MDRFDARPSRPRVSFHLFFIGKNSRGYWVDQDHLRGGLFADRAEALRFALFEKKTAIGLRRWSWVPGVLELNMSAAPLHAAHRPVMQPTFPEQRAA